MARKKSAAQLDREVREVLAHCPDCSRPFDLAARRHARDPGVNRFLIPACCAGDYLAANPAWRPTRPVHATKKDEWSVVVEDGYVKVKRDGETIAAAIDTGGRRLTGIEFTRPEYQRSNPTRQKAMRVLQQEGYR